ncbi:hypothetical protein [Labrys okinawensis]|uniref:hypothetical protein n=1 Tax=Labrys okinawensis TaxID=346911 RepID=UPI0015E48C2C|nr:hypothetical protein [Labrys okinawensis]
MGHVIPLLPPGIIIERLASFVQLHTIRVLAILHAGRTAAFGFLRLVAAAELAFEDA